MFSHELDPMHPSLALLDRYLNGHGLRSSPSLGVHRFKPASWLILSWHPSLRRARFGAIAAKYRSLFEELDRYDDSGIWKQCTTRVGYRLANVPMAVMLQRLRPNLNN